MSSETPFKWHHFQADVILLCVRWYLRYPISYRDLEGKSTEWPGVTSLRSETSLPKFSVLQRNRPFQQVFGVYNDFLQHYRKSRATSVTPSMPY